MKYDVVVLGDIAPRRLPRPWSEALADLVSKRGTTLVLLAGAAHMPADWVSSPIGPLLPITPAAPGMASRAVAGLAEVGLSLRLTTRGEASPLTRLLPGRGQNAELWELLPAHYWLAMTEAVAPGAEVLVTVTLDDVARLPGGELFQGDSTDRRSREAFLRDRGAVLVTRPAGAGRVLYAGVDSTWRWRYRVGEELFDRFWGQVIRWALARRLGAGDDYVRIGTDEIIYRAPATVHIEALVTDGAGTPIEDTEVVALIEPAAGESPRRVRLRAIAGSGGRYVGEIRTADLPDPPAAGVTGEATGGSVYSARILLPTVDAYERIESPAQAPFVVEPPPDPERRDAVRDETRLRAMAAAAGGSYLPLDQIAALPDLIPRQEITVREDRSTGPWEFPGTTAALLLGLLAVEWILRKLFYLV